MAQRDARRGTDVIRGVYAGYASAFPRDMRLDVDVFPRADGYRVIVRGPQSLMRHSFSHTHEGFSFDDTLELDERVQGKGFGALLVRAREDIVRRLGGGIVVINQSETDGFWARMGYVQAGTDVYSFLRDRGVKIGSNVRYKVLN